MIKILLVDDEFRLLDIAKVFLKDLYFDVETSLSAKDAIEKLRTTTYDVIVSDYQMPDMNGIEFLKIIRSLANPVPFILFTGKGREEVVIEALNAGADFYLQKGGNPQAQFMELANMIDKAVQKRRMEIDLLQNELKFKTIFNSANDSIFIHDLDGRIIEINDIGCSWLGFTKREMMEKNVKDLNSDRWVIQAQDRIREVIESGFTLFETEWVTKSGKKIPIEVSSRKILYAGNQAILSVARDVSERNMNEMILIENELKFRTVANFTFDWEYWVVPDGRILFCSPSCARISGYSSTEIQANPGLILGMVHPEDKSCFARHLETEMRTEPFELDLRIITANGETRWISHSCQAVFDDDGEYLGRRVGNRDITHHKKVDETLRESEEIMRFIVKHDLNAVAVFDRDLHYIAVSDRYLKDYDVKEENIIGKHHYEIFPETPQKWKEVHKRCLAGAIERNDDDSFENADGSITYNRWECRPWHRVDGEIGGIITYTEVITERKLAEEALRKSERFLNCIVEDIPDMIFVKGVKDLRFIRINKAGEELLGYSQEEILGRNVYDFFPKDQADIFAEQDRVVLRNKQLMNIPMESVHTRNKGERILHTKKMPIPNDAGDPQYVMSISEDITERRQAEDALLESREMYHQLVDSAAEAIVVAQDGMLRVVNPMAVAIMGIPEQEILSRPFISFIHPDDREIVEERYQRRLKGEAVPPRYAFRVLANEGIIKWVEISAVAIDWEGRPATLNFLTDVTERKKAEDELRREKDKLYSLINSISDEVWLSNSKGEYILANPSALHEFSLDAVNGVDVTKLASGANVFRPDGSERPLEEAPTLRALRGEVVKNVEEIVRTPATGELRYRLVSAAPVRDAEGSIMGSVSVVRDVTDHVRAERELRESVTRFRELFNNLEMGVAVFEATPEGDDFIIKDLNEKAESIEGVRKQEVIGKRLTEVFPGADSMGMVDVLGSVWRTGKKEWLSDATYTDPNGESSSRENSVFKLATGEIVAVYGDITHRKEADNDLRMMRYVFNESNAAMGIADDRGIMTQVNDSFLRYLGYHGREEVIGRPIGDFMSDRGETELILKQLDLQGQWEGNYQARRKDGSTLMVHGLTIVLKDENGRPIGYHSTAVDTTGQKTGHEAGPTTGVKLNLLSNITVHDIQNQVVVLNGLIHKAKHANSQIQTREYLSRMHQVADKIQSHVAFARDYQNLGKAPPIWIRLDISVQDLTSKFDSKWVQFEIELGTLEVFSDVMLNRAFYNLIDDTLKHGQKATKIKFSAMTRGEDLILLYEDNGVGVPMDRKRNIFEKPLSGQKVHGLVLVKEILAITGMTIVENGVPGKSARFEIFVPKGNFRYAANETV